MAAVRQCDAGSVRAAEPSRLAGHAEPAAGRHQMERTLDPARLGDHLDRLYRAAWALCGSRRDARDPGPATDARPPARPGLPRTPRSPRSEAPLGSLLRALRNTFLNQKRTESRRVRSAPLPDTLDLV